MPRPDLLSTRNGRASRAPSSVENCQAGAATRRPLMREPIWEHSHRSERAEWLVKMNHTAILLARMALRCKRRQSGDCSAVGAAGHGCDPSGKKAVFDEAAIAACHLSGCSRHADVDRPARDEPDRSHRDRRIDGNTEARICPAIDPWHALNRLCIMCPPL